MSVPYRDDINGIRAIAVTLVILTHISSSILSGGFIGVDVFFVISGFLITRIICNQIVNGSFSLIDFLERRARRLLPALIIVVLSTAIVGYFLLPPRALVDFGQSIVASILFASNILFFLEAGYFDTASKLKPLLHTWSLGIEEQFYILLPLLLIAVHKVGSRYVFPVLLVLAVSSLALSIYYLPQNPDLVFYLLPFRAWELLLGGCLGLGTMYAPCVLDERIRNFLGFLGLLGLALAAFYFDSSSPLPGPLSLLPVVSTMIIIYASPSTGPVNFFLTHPIMSFLGTISYGAYLWHFPLLAFWRNFNGDNLGLGVGCLAVASIIVLASLSYKYVEVPYRENRSLGKTVALGTISAGCLICLLIGLAFHFSKGLPDRANFSQKLAGSMMKPERLDGCFDYPYLHSKDQWGCFLGKTKSSTDLVLMGDSHALSMLKVISELGEENGLSIFFAGYSGCIPLPRLRPIRRDQEERNCEELNARLYQFARNSEAKAIVLVARWSHYYYQSSERQPQLFESDIPDGLGSLMENNLRRIGRSLDDIYSIYLAENQRVFILTEIPTQKFSPENIYFKAQKTGKSVKSFSVLRKDHLRSTGPFTKMIDSRATLQKIDVMQEVCGEQKCDVGSAEESYYYDNNHLSEPGARRLKPLLSDIFISLKNSNKLD